MSKPIRGCLNQHHPKDDGRPGVGRLSGYREKQIEMMQSIRDLKTKIALEKGCVSCRVYQNPDNPDEFIVFEQWVDEKQAYAHLDSENLAVLVGAGSVLSKDINVSLARDPSVEVMEELFKERMLKKEK